MKRIIEICTQFQHRLVHPQHQHLSQEQLIQMPLNLTVAAFLSLKQQVRQYIFQDLDEEIQFYKKVEPVFFERLVYYNRLFDVASKAPFEKSAMLTYYQDHIFTLQQYLDDHRFLMHYDKSGKGYLDSLLFIHPTVDMSVYPETEECTDAAYFNYTSFAIAKTRAYSQLIKYLQQKMDHFRKEGHSASSLHRPISFLYESEPVATENEAVRNKLSWLEAGISTESAEADLYIKKLAGKRNRAASLLSQLGDYKQ